MIALDELAVRELAPMRSVVSAVRDALMGMERGEFEFPQRIVLGGGQALIMPLFHRPTASSVTKILSLDADRQPFITGAVTWMAKGVAEQIVADAVAATALRTGAITGVAVDLLADSRVKTLTIFGAGAQSMDQVRAVLAVRAIEEVTVASRNLSRAEGTMQKLKAEFPSVRFIATDNGCDSLRHADIVACATTTTEPLFSVADLGENAVVTAIGSFRPDMHEFPQELIATGCPVYVDGLEACMTEAGEIIEALNTGLVRPEALVPLGRALLEGVVPGRPAIFKSVGIAALDWAVMTAIRKELANRAEIGKNL